MFCWANHKNNMHKDNTIKEKNDQRAKTNKWKKMNLK